jgi:redox-sensitive bicupin YhaK (pirin superfamily)
MDDAVIETFPLGTQWPTIDPFLFCAHHDDRYPAGTASLGPDAPLTGRSIGQDFAGVDGWNMYHGTVVPGFPQHPHRGFETVTYVRSGLIDHADSLGATARFGRGDTQWLTAGAGIQHCEMFPLVDRDGPNHLELFQIWLNLPAADKLVEPYFTMFWRGDIPVATPAAGVTITVVAGELDGHVPPPPPPDSWASRTEAEVAIWHLTLDPGASWSLPRAADGVARTLYVFEGDALAVGDTTVPAGHGAVIRCDRPVDVSAVNRTDALVLQGRPIGEPVAQYGPFVMNTRAELAQAVDDYQRTQFGGWPWPAPDPDHGAAQGRFARHPDGRVVEPGD